MIYLESWGQSEKQDEEPRNPMCCSMKHGCVYRNCPMYIVPNQVILGSVCPKKSGSCAQQDKLHCEWSPLLFSLDHFILYPHLRWFEHTSGAYPKSLQHPNKKNPFINLSEVARGMLCAGSLVLFWILCRLLIIDLDLVDRISSPDFGLFLV